LKEKEKEKLHQQADEFCQRLGGYRQPMAWSILPVFNPDGSLFITPTATFKPIYRQKPDVSDALFFSSWGDLSKVLPPPP